MKCLCVWTCACACACSRHPGAHGQSSLHTHAHARAHTHTHTQALLEALEQTESGFPGVSCLAWDFSADDDTQRNPDTGAGRDCEMASTDNIHPPQQQQQHETHAKSQNAVQGAAHATTQNAGWLPRVLGWIGRQCASRPRRVVGAWSSVVVVSLVCLWVVPMQVLQDPVKLWAQVCA